MNPRIRRLALCGIAATAVLASINAAAHSYIGLHAWAAGHGLNGWWAWSWPAQIDVFLVAGELALYVAYLDAWPRRATAWPWAVALTGLVVSVAGNVGHVASGRPADQLTAAAAPVAAFAGLWVGLLTLKETTKRASGGEHDLRGVQHGQNGQNGHLPAGGGRRSVTPEIEASALAILTQQPTIAAAEFARRLDLPRTTARRLRDRLEQH